MDVPAQFPGGLKSFNSYMVKNFDNKVSCSTTDSFHKILVEFVVSKQGFLYFIKAQAPCDPVRQECQRILAISDQWIPAQHNGKFVSSRRKMIVYIPVK